MYGAEPGKPSFANTCLLARRLVERGVRFVEIFHEAWDQHGDLVRDLKKNCERHRPGRAPRWSPISSSAACSTTRSSSGAASSAARRWCKATSNGDGRDHHPNAFTMWLAGGGIKPGVTLGESDDFGFNVTRDRVHVHDLHATILHLLGLDHTRLTFKFQGLDQKLTGVEPARVVHEILA